MATLKEAIEYARSNPTSDFARQLRTRIESGEANADAAREGIDLSFARKTPAPVRKVVQEEAEPPFARTGILQEEIQKTGEQIAERFGEAEGFVEKATVAGTVPLRAVGAGARAVGRAIAEPLAPVMEKIISSLPEETQKSLGTLAEKGGAALEKVRGIVGEDVYQSLADTVEAFSLFGGGRVAKTGVEATIPLAKEAVGATVQAGKELVGGTANLALKGAQKTIETAGKAGEGIKSGTERVIRSLDTGTISGIPKNVDEFIDTSLEKALRPSVTGKKTAGDVTKYQERGREAVKTIIGNKKNLQFVDEAGDVVSRLPETLKETTEAIQQTKKQIFSEYNALSKQAGKEGANVDLKPIAKEVQKIADNEVLFDTNPAVAEYAASRAKSLETRGVYTPEQAEEAIKIFNQSLEAFYKNPDYANASKAAIDALVVNNMRKALDDVIESATGAEYQALKNKYGALKTIEKDAVRRAVVEGRKNIKGLIDFSDILSGGQVLTGLATMNPALIASGSFQKGIASLYKLWNSPDSTIKRMFEGAEQAMIKTP